MLRPIKKHTQDLFIYSFVYHISQICSGDDKVMTSSAIQTKTIARKDLSQKKKHKTKQLLKGVV